LLHPLPARPPGGPSEPAAALHRRAPIVDLVVGTILFRRSLLVPLRHGHVDLPRLRAGGVNVIGLTVATRHPDLRGTLSSAHFRSLGLPARSGRTNMAIAEWLIERIETVGEESAGAIQLIRHRVDLARCLAPGGPLGVFVGVQGGHVLDGELSNVGRLGQRGVRMFAPAHVMDNALAGSGTGRRRGGLTGYGREVIEELERQEIIVDLAHMSRAAIDDALPLLRRPFVLSHTGLTEMSGRASRWRRYSPATRNVPAAVARDVGQAGGLVGIMLASQLLGGASIEAAVRTIRLALEVAGPERVAIGSDMDGGLRTVVDAAGLPALTDGLLAVGLEQAVVEGVMGANAIRLLSAALPE
jgi:membrane dipeptidase